jgi:6-phosphogluconolactonase
MKNFELIPFTSADELARAAASAWLDEIAAANHAAQPHCVALSGGRITQKFFTATVEQAKTRKISFERVHFFWADERCVPPIDPDSNFKMADELLFRPLNISAEKIHRLRGELQPAKAVELATAEILRIVRPAQSPPSPQRGEGRGEEAGLSNSNPLTPILSPLGRGEGAHLPPVLDLILLGMGEDGHVASLFPNAPAKILDISVPFLVVENSPKPPPTRISLSYKTIFAAKTIWILVSGAGKESALRESLSPHGQTPLARVIQSRPVKIFSDLTQF